MNSFEKINFNFGLGCMRFPIKNGEVDYDTVNDMIDSLIKNGFNYFDTAHGYMDKKSEIALKKCLTSRYKREEYVLTNKLSTFFFEKNEDIRPLFESQLEACGVEYFDFYLMHAQDRKLYEKFKKCRAYETVLQLKEEGKFNHFGISFHDNSDLLERILNDYPQIEVVQIQFNYLDYNDPYIESKKCYEVCRKYNKPVIVMEPIKGGSLCNLPKEALDIFDKMENKNPANYALRFAAGFDGIMMVLSGMSSVEMIEENIGFMKNFKPLDDSEREVLDKILEIVKRQNIIQCTSCRYCTDGCPKNIRIPDLFSCFNGKKFLNSWNYNYYYRVNTHNSAKASDCIGCGKCEEICPQHLKIRELLKDVASEFEK